MQARTIQQQPKRRLPLHATGMQRSQERILDPQHRRVASLGDGHTALRTGGRAPHADPIAVGRASDGHRPARKLKDPLDPPLGQKTAVVDAQTPGSRLPGVCMFERGRMHHPCHSPRVPPVAAVVRPCAPPSVPVIDAMVRFH